MANLTEVFTNIANAIRNKTGKTSTMTPSEMMTEIDTLVKPTSTKSAATYTPNTSDQTIAAGTYCSGTQTIKGDANLVAENIKSGVSIFGVVGSLENAEGGTYTLVNNSSTAYIEYCGNWLAPNSSVVSSLPAYSKFTYSGIPCQFSPRISIIVPSGSTLLSNISAKVGDVSKNIASSSFYNMGTSVIGTHYVLATTNTAHATLFLKNGDILTIVAN